jgi:hypothetical protein
MCHGSPVRPVALYGQFFSVAASSRLRLWRATWWFAFAAATFGLTASLAAASDGQGTGPREDLVELTVLAPATSAVPPISPITGKQRLTWIVKATIGPQSLAGGVWSAGLGSWKVKPPEYGRGWDGFGKRYGMRLTGVSVGNAIEGSLGAAWGEDPRYPRSGTGSVWQRVGHSAKMTLAAPYADGHVGPSYARYAGIVGNNFLSNAWRVDSEANTRAAFTRVAFGVLGRFTGNMFEEFWPSVMTKVRK